MNELHTAYAIRNALDRGADALPAAQAQALAAARQRALASMRTAAPARRAARPSGPGRDDAPSWLTRLALTAAPVGLVVVGAFALAQIKDEQRLEALAELDKAVLIDDVPLSAYADAGFGVFLHNVRQ